MAQLGFFDADKRLEALSAKGDPSPCCARAASGPAAAAPPTAASTSRRPMVTVIRPSRARCVRERYHATSVLSLTAPHPARAQRRSPRAGDGSDRLSAHGDVAAPSVHIR